MAHIDPQDATCRYVQQQARLKQEPQSSMQHPEGESSQPQSRSHTTTTGSRNRLFSDAETHAISTATATLHDNATITEVCAKVAQDRECMSLGIKPREKYTGLQLRDKFKSLRKASQKKDKAPKR